MKTARTITILCWIIVALVLTGLAVWFLTGTLFGFRTNSGFFGFGGWETLTGPYEAVDTYNVPAGNVDSLNVDWISGSVRVEPYDGDEMQIIEYAQRELRDSEKLQLSTSGGTVTIKFCESGLKTQMPSKKLEVFVPRTVADNMKKLSLDNTSGDISASGFNTSVFNSETTSGNIQLSNISSLSINVNSASGDINVSSITTSGFDADTTSGSLQLSYITSQSLDADSTSGSITISSVNSDKIIIESMSGTVRLSDSSAKTLECDTTSGDQYLSGSFDRAELESMSGKLSLNNSADRAALEADTTSGDQDFSGSFNSAKLEAMSGKIAVTSAVVPAELQVDTTSGNVTVAVPDEGALTVHHSATSGKFSCDIPVIQTSRDAQFRFSTMSGDVKILALER